MNTSSLWDTIKYIWKALNTSIILIVVLCCAVWIGLNESGKLTEPRFGDKDYGTVLITCDGIIDETARVFYKQSSGGVYVVKQLVQSVEVIWIIPVSKCVVGINVPSPIASP